MSAPVDALAVLDKEIARAGGVYFEDGRNLVEARAAVAELIEAANAADEAMIPFGLMAEPKRRLSAAIARVQGGAA